MSSYIEASGNGQTVASRGNIVFSVDEASLDVVGNDIELNAAGTVFTIKRAGLYHVEWSVNLASGTQPVLICLTEGGEPASAMSNIASTGNYSSGALIHVAAADVPYAVSLHNYGGAIVLNDPTGYAGTAASIRILRFADGPVA